MACCPCCVCRTSFSKSRALVTATCFCVPRTSATYGEALSHTCVLCAFTWLCIHGFTCCCAMHVLTSSPYHVFSCILIHWYAYASAVPCSVLTSPQGRSVPPPGTTLLDSRNTVRLSVTLEPNAPRLIPYIPPPAGAPKNTLQPNTPPPAWDPPDPEEQFIMVSLPDG